MSTAAFIVIAILTLAAALAAASLPTLIHAALSFAVAFVGIASFPFLPVAPLPQVDFPTLQVTANWQGASAETMATSVAVKDSRPRRSRFYVELTSSAPGGPR